MVIDSGNINGTPGSHRGKVSANEKAVSTTASQADTTKAAGKADGALDNVSFSNEAQTFAKLESAVAASPSVNAERVAEVLASIADGDYQINAEAIATKLLE